MFGPSAPKSIANATSALAATAVHAHDAFAAGSVAATSIVVPRTPAERTRSAPAVSSKYLSGRNPPLGVVQNAGEGRPPVERDRDRFVVRDARGRVEPRVAAVERHAEETGARGSRRARIS